MQVLKAVADLYVFMDIRSSKWTAECEQTWNYKIAQKIFFSLKGFSELGIGETSGSSLACDSQKDISSAAALDTWKKEM